MKTPYCTALRVQRREMDQIKISISVEATRLSTLEAHEDGVRSAAREERGRVAEDWTIPSAAYFTRVRGELAALQQQRAVTDARLDQLRGQAREAYGSLRAVEIAAEAYKVEAERVAQSAEQAALDDRSAADVMRALRLVRAAHGRSVP